VPNLRNLVNADGEKNMKVAEIQELLQLEPAAGKKTTSIKMSQGGTVVLPPVCRPYGPEAGPGFFTISSKADQGTLHSI